MVSQAMMSLQGHDIPLGRSTGDQNTRLKIFDIIKPYCFSTEELAEVYAADSVTRTCWLETFTNSQKGIIGTSLLGLAKEEFRTKFFPADGAYPAKKNAALIGLPPSTSFLERLVLYEVI
jgi:hypothetical protein